MRLMSVRDHERLPSVAQMAARCNSGHRLALERIADKTQVARPNATDGEIRGWRTVLATLRRWQCVAIGDVGEGVVLLDRGAALLAALSARAKEAP